MKRTLEGLRSNGRLLSIAVLVLASCARQSVSGQEAAGGRIPSEGFRAAARRAAPTVVSILSSKTIRVSPELDPFWDLFGRQFDVPKQYRERGLGSGVVVSVDGYVLTNEHVIKGAEDIRVVFPDRKEFKAKVVGSDSGTDVAVLKIDATGLKFLNLADSSATEVGDVVLAIGNPFGIGETVTMGIVSAVARRGVIDPQNYSDFIQTDAAINPGNSGGALVTAQGDLIGINTAILSRSGGYQGIGFAVPSNVARQTMSQIVKQGRVIHGWLGVTIQPVNAAVAKAFGLKEPKGVLVSDVSSGGPAAKAGISRGDIIVDLNGEAVNHPDELRTKIAFSVPETSVTMTLVRDGRERKVSVQLGELREKVSNAPQRQTGPSAIEGLKLEALDPKLARELGLPSQTKGVAVTAVNPDSAGADAGLRAGDVILEVNRRPVASVDAVERALINRDSDSVVLLVNRAGSTIYIVIEPR